MGHLRDRMAADLVLAGRAKSTRLKYIGYAAAFVKHFMRSPEQLGEADVRAWLLHLLEVRHLSIGAYLQYLGALKFLYRVTLQRPEVVDAIPWPKQPRSRPDVPTRPEVVRILDAAHSPFWRAFFTTAYAAGLRRMEVAALCASHVDSASGLLRVARGKNDKPREVMLDPELLVLLRQHWREHRLPGPFLFPARTRFGGWADHPVALGQASDAFHRAVQAAQLGRRVTLHGLRHAFATHLLEDGVDLYTIQLLLGHERLETTTVYTRVRTDQIRATPSPLQKLRQ
jgi:site-specific recombinase XerD